MDISAANGITSKSVELICPYGENGSEIDETLYQMAINDPANYQVEEITSDLYCQWKYNTKKISIDYGSGESFEGNEIRILEPDKLNDSTGVYTGTYDLAVDRATPLWAHRVDETVFGKKINGVFAGDYQIRTYLGTRSGYTTIENQTETIGLIFFIRKDRFYFLKPSGLYDTVTENVITRWSGATVTVLERFPIAT